MFYLKKQFSLSLICLLLAFMSCQENKDTHDALSLSKFLPLSKDSSKKLVEELKLVDTSKVEFAIEGYEEIDGKRYLITNIEEEPLSLNLPLLIPDSAKGLEMVVAKKAISYRGAILNKLKYKIEETPNHIEFVFQSVETILD